MNRIKIRLESGYVSKEHRQYYSNEKRLGAGDGLVACRILERLIAGTTSKSERPLLAEDLEEPQKLSILQLWKEFSGVAWLNHFTHGMRE